MDIFIIDTNVIFSAILNVESGIGQFILKTKEHNISLFSPSYVKTEIEKHFTKIVNRSKLSEADIRLAMELIYSRIVFISDDLIPFEEYIKAMRIVRDIDPDDVVFVALTSYMDKVLCTSLLKQHLLASHHQI